MAEEKILAITACTVGVAHTYMAAENLESAAKEMGIDMKVETHGSVGIENEFTQQDIDDADGIIIASDPEINKERFAGKQIISVPVKKGISQPEELIEGILNNEGRVYSQKEGSSSNEENEKVSNKDINSWKDLGNVIYKSIMNGVSYMVPFVVTGGLLMALALTIGGETTEAGLVIEEGTFWYYINMIANSAMGLMVPILSGYTAFSIADRPGLVPGLVGGIIATNGAFYNSEASTGFIGGILAGILAGLVARWLKNIKVPKSLQTVMPIIFIPIISTLIVGLIFIYLIGAPIAALFDFLLTWLASLQGTSALILGLIIGAFIAIDLGGPFNKTAFLFGSGLIPSGEFSVMGAVAVAVCIPPIAMGISSYIYKNKFTQADRDTGTASMIMGFFGITEGTVPFAASDIRIIPAVMGGSMVGSALAMITGVGGRVAHGGPIVALLGGIDNIIWFFIAVIIGTLVAVILVKFFKKDLEVETAESQQGVTVEEDSAVAAGESSIAEGQTEETIQLTNLTNKSLFTMNVTSTTKEDAIYELLDSLGEQFNTEQLAQDVLKREEEGSTGMGDGIAIPHGSANSIEDAIVLFGRSEEGVEWDSLDGQPAHIIFMILVPASEKNSTHLKILQMLSRNLMHSEFYDSLMYANNEEEVYEILDKV